MLIKKEDLIKKYTVDHMTMQEIANEYKCSKVWIYKLIKKYNIDIYEGEHVKVVCGNPDCAKKEFEVTRSRIKNRKEFIGNIYCSEECYHNHRKQVNKYKGENRNNQRKAHKVLLENNIEVLPNQVVHHIDGDTSNNSKENLMVFNSQSEHLEYHHQLRIGSL
jgi:predicted DNA-binding protein YlxM (UPF0122 family)